MTKRGKYTFNILTSKIQNPKDSKIQNFFEYEDDVTSQKFYSMKLCSGRKLFKIVHKLLSDCVYKVHLKHRWISCLDLGPTSKLSQYDIQTFQNLKKISTMKFIWFQAFWVRDIQPVQTDPALLFRADPPIPHLWLSVTDGHGFTAYQAFISATANCLIQGYSLPDYSP